MRAKEFLSDGLRNPKDNPCWKGYRPVGTKKKAGKTVPNCVREFTELEKAIMEGGHSLDEVNMDSQKGIGAVPFNADIDYFGIRVLVKPSTFLGLARELPVNDDTKERISKMAEYIKGGGPVGQPWFNVTVPSEWREGDFSKLAKITGHEGRHRMEAIIQAEGNAPVEVHLLFPGGVRARDISPEWVAALNKYIINERGQVVAGPWFKEFQ